MKKGHWILVVIGLLLVVGWFYWFQLRPSKIRSFCDWRVRNENNWRPISKSGIYDIQYEACLHEKGLK